MDKWIDWWCGFFFVLAIGLNTHQIGALLGLGRFIYVYKVETLDRQMAVVVRFCQNFLQFIFQPVKNAIKVNFLSKYSIFSRIYRQERAKNATFSQDSLFYSILPLFSRRKRDKNHFMRSNSKDNYAFDLSFWRHNT